MSSLAVLAGLLLQKFGFTYGDALAGFIVALLIKETALSVKNVVGVHDLRAHYVGPKLHVELHIEVPPNLTLKEAHDISEEVKKRIEELEEVERAFVHVDIKGVTK